MTGQDTAAPAGRNLTDEALTRAVLASFDHAGSERLKTILQRLVAHLHAFVQEVQLTEEEWQRGIDFLTRVGHTTTATRQEFILLSDVLGISMLVIGLNQRRPPAATPSTVVGPFYLPGSPRFELGDDLAAGAPGEPCLVGGQVRSLTGDPVPAARIEVWQADEQGLYDVQRPGLERPQGRGQLVAGPDGRFWFWTVQPTAYPIPDDGPVGELLAAANRSPMRPAHVHFMVTAPGFQRLVTHVFVAGDPYLDSDAVFGVKSELVCTFERHQPGTAPDGTVMDRPYSSATYDLVLTPARDGPCG